MADIISNAPRLSLAERDRRWAKTRALMAEHSVDVLLVPGLRGRESYESYLSNESIQGIVVLPADRDPIYLTWSAFRIVGRTDPQNSRKYWIDDIRSGLLGPLVVGALTELGALSGRIGVVGVNSKNPMELEGFVPYVYQGTGIDTLTPGLVGRPRNKGRRVLKPTGKCPACGWGLSGRKHRQICGPE